VIYGEEQKKRGQSWEKVLGGVDPCKREKKLMRGKKNENKLTGA